MMGDAVRTLSHDPLGFIAFRSDSKMMKERGSRNETESNSTLQITTVSSPGIPVEILGDLHEAR